MKPRFNPTSRSKETKKKETKQNKNNKVKRLVMRYSPCEDVLDSPALAPGKYLLTHVLTSVLGDPKRKV